VAPVFAVDPTLRRIVAAGQTILLDAMAADPTGLEGLRDLDDLEMGDVIEVYGRRDDDGNVRASHVERRTRDSSVRVMGEVQLLDAAGRTFVLHGIEIAFAQAMVLPAGARLENGQRVAVFASVVEGDDRIPAVVVAIQPGPVDEGASALVAGPVTGFLSLSRFIVNGVTVDAGSAVFDGKVAQPLANGRGVSVQGVLRGGVLSASTVTLADDAAPLQAEVVASISEFADLQGFRVRGVGIDASQAAFTGLTPANLGNGVRVRVSGPLRGALVQASRITVDAGDPGEALTQIGEVSGFDAASGRFLLVGLAQPMRLDPLVRFLTGSPAQFVDGARVDVRGLVSAVELVVRDVRVLAADAPVELSGIAGNVEAIGSAGAFEIGPTDLQWTSLTVFLGPTNSVADLIDGRVVRVTAAREAGALRATQIDARSTLPGTVRIRGTIEQFASPSQFRVGGQRVDAGAARFEPASLAATLDGAYVDVEGSLVDGVLMASAVNEL
jgi:hypothetical protein